MRFFLFVLILEGDSVSQIENEGKFWWLSSFKIHNPSISREQTVKEDDNKDSS